MHIEIDPAIFNQAFLPYLNDDTRTQIFFGGSASGKSVFLSQRVVYDLLKGGRNYVVVRNVGNTLRTSVFNETRKVISNWEVGHLFKINKSEMSITCRNGYQAICRGLDDVDKIKSITPERGVVTDIWIEEATETIEDDIKQLNKRLRGPTKVKKRLTMSFNPIMRSHWLFGRYFGGFADDDKEYRDERLLILKTTYKDNRFLEEDDIYELEHETNKYWYDVYTLGNWGILGAVVFDNWEVRDLSKVKKKFDNYKNGLDFGFTNDPTAFVRMHYDKKRKILYITNELYERGLTNQEIAKALKPLIGSEYVTCDSAEPKSIEELKRENINALGALKGKDSVGFGIQFLKGLKIVIDITCQNVINEFQLYQWKKTRDGDVLNIPVDRDNHTIDAIRYGMEDEAIQRGLVYAI